ncbi:MAG: peptidylprolyl isomerase, partial [bacterium]|nr:peptidylprolyl isomerase [bacterium]
AILLAGCEATRVPSTAILSRDEFDRTVETRDWNVQPAAPVANATETTPIPAPDVISAPRPDALTIAGPGDSTPVSTRRPIVRVTGPIAASSGITDVEAIVGSTLAAEQPKVIGGSVFVDSKVGDVNGKPVYAGTFLAPMAERLRAQAVELTRPEWDKFARTEITRELDLFIEDELLRAEALASFTPEQKQGFFGFMESLSKKMQSESYGSRALAEKKAAEADGKSFDEAIRRRQDDELIKYQLGEQIYRRVNISWRDIEQTYDRFYDTFNPTPKATFRMIQVLSTKPEDREAVATRLAAGESFKDVATSKLNIYKAKDGGLDALEVKGSREGAKIYLNPNLNEAAQTLPEGQIAGPIELDGSVAWITLESIDARTRSLYEAQLAIENYLREGRSNEERNKYIDRLRKRASMSSVDDMRDRLVEIAADRFYVTGP